MKLAHKNQMSITRKLFRLCTRDKLRATKHTDTSLFYIAETFFKLYANYLKQFSRRNYGRKAEL